MGCCNTCYFNLIVTINYLKSDLIKKQRAFKIGLISIFLVVFFLTLLLNAIELCSCIFIKLSEEQTGEIDLIFTPYLTSHSVSNQKSGFDSFFYNKTTEKRNSTFNLNNLNFLNFYEIEKKLENLSYIEGVTPRWMITGKAKKIGEGNNDNFKTNIFIIDSAIENNIGIGRKLSLAELKENECYISTTLFDALKLNIGSQIEMKISLSDLLQAYSQGEEGGEDEEDQQEPQNKIKTLRNLKEENNFSEENKRPLNNKFKRIKKLLIESGIFKNILESFFQSIINKNVNEKINEIIKSINQYFSNKINLDEIKNLSIKKSYLKNPFLQSNHYIKTLTEILFPEESQENKENTFLQKMITSIIKQIFIYDESTEIIKVNQDLFTILKTGQIPESFKHNIDYDSILDQFDPFPYFDNITKFLNFKLNLTIKERIDPTDGKWPSASGNAIAFDSKHIKQYLYLNAERIVDEIVKALNIEAMRNLIWNFINNYLKDFDINKYSLTVNAIFKDKFDIYKKDQKSMRHYISNIAGEITTLLGEDFQVNIQAPIYAMISTVEIAKLFLQDIFIGIMFFLWILCVLLVYSLMLGNVNERTYEFGMMRSLGFKKNNLILLIVLQGFIFALPGTLLGLITSYIANNFVAYLFNWYTGLVMPFILSKYNIIFGIAIGISVPLISSYFPIKKSLEDNLRETLDIFNKKIGDIVVSIIKLEYLGVSPTTLLAAITLIFIGLATYYLAPMSFLLLDFQLFLFIMIAILITMLLGLIILTQLLVPYLQNLILRIIIFISYVDRNLYLIVLKNLEGHKKRNRQVSIMFMVALGFRLCYFFRLYFEFNC